MDPESTSSSRDIYDSFSKMGLQENLLKGIHHYGLEKPSIVHQKGIVPLCKGLSVIQQSLSGTTFTLCCGVLQQLDYGLAECQALILVPTRDLAQETKKTIEALGQFLGVRAHTCTGKRTLSADQKILSSGVQVVVGTPGRIIYMLEKHALCSDHIKMLLLDEADELLTRGFKDQTYNIIQLLPPKIQVGLFSVLISNEALETTCKFMDAPVTVIVPRDEELKDMRIKQYYVKVENEEHKLGKLYDVLDTRVCEQIIIFVNARNTVKSLTEQIRGKGYNVSVSHGGLHQQTRNTAIQELQSGSSSILIATDLRGTDAMQIDTVINYDLPTQPMQYLRRVQQQSGQSGREGMTISFVTPADVHVHSKIRKFFKNQIRKLPSNF